MADLGDFFGKNKAFCLVVGGGFAALLVGEAAINMFYGSELESARAQIRVETRELKKEMPNAANLETVQTALDKLKKGVAQIEGRTQFDGSKEFELADGGVIPENQYFDIVTRTRERLVSRAHHANVDLPESLGLPALSPTNKEEISRYLRGLDLVQRAVTLAIEQRIVRIDDLRIEPDSRTKRKEKDGKGPMTEEVRVKMKILGSGAAIASFYQATQNGAKPFLLERAKIAAAPKGDLLTGDFDFLVLRFLGETPAPAPASAKTTQ